MLTSLLEAADRVDSTTGLQMAYLKAWAPRSYNELALRLPEPVAGPAGTVSRLDANVLAPRARRRSRLHRPAVQPALVLLQLPRVGDARPLGRARELRRREQARRLPRAAERLQLEAQRARARSRSCSASIRAPWLLVSVSNEGFHDAGELARAPVRARLRRPDRRRLEALRRRADRDLQPFGREGRHRLAPAKPRDPAHRRARTACSSRTVARRRCRPTGPALSAR